MLKYRCLVLDHDDTVVRSAQTVNYPALVENLKEIHPDRHISLAQFNRLCCTRGFVGMCREALGLTDEEIAQQFDFWKVYVRTHIPPAYAGIDTLLHRFRREGGLICVSSHSSEENITRDYQRNFGFVPDEIFPFELGDARRKPAPYALEEIMRKYALQPQELLMVDDMKSGSDMAKRCAVPFACAGWSHDDAEIAELMRRESEHYFSSVAEFSNFLFETETA